MTEKKLPEELVLKIKSVTALRAKRVLDFLTEHGSITTEDIEELGYMHPPRAIRDVREEGIPLDTKFISKDGKRMAQYTFGDISKIENNKLGGRQVFSKKFKAELISLYGSKCNLTMETYQPKYLQIDHRIPYEVAGEMSGDERTLDKFMLLSGAAQRQKSWECEHCENLKTIKDIKICQTCYWAYPESYSHVALRNEKRLDLVFQDDEKTLLDEIKEQAQAQNLSVKALLLQSFSRKN